MHEEDPGAFSIFLQRGFNKEAARNAPRQSNCISIFSKKDLIISLKA